MGNLIAKFKELFSGRQMEIVIVGLENSGKSTLANKLSLDKALYKGPTLGVDIKHFKKDNVSVKVWDLGGHGWLTSPVQVGVVEIRNGLRRHSVRCGHD